MGRLSTKVKQVVSKEINRKPTKKDYKDVEVKKELGRKGEVSMYYKDRLLDKVCLK